MIVHKLNESFSAIEADKDVIARMFEFLRVEIPGAQYDPAVKAGFKSRYEYFGSIQNEMLVVMNGHLSLLSSFGVTSEVEVSDYTEADLDEYLLSIKDTLPFQPYDFQELAFRESVLKVKGIAKLSTSSGKSLTISLIADFFRTKGMKGLLLVPNINLLTQFKNDIKDYNLLELYDDTHTIGGGETDKHFNNSLTISTWQSLMNYREDLDKIDYIICDECLHPETLIDTREGKVEINKIKINDEVLTINETTDKKEFKRVKKLHKNISREKMFKITLESGEVLMITGNHKVRTINRGWVRTDELTIEDEILHA